MSPSRPAGRTDRARKLRSQQTQPASPSLNWKAYGYAVLVMVVLFIIGALVVYLRPLAVLQSLTRARLAYNGFHNEYTTIHGNRIHYYEGGRATGAPVLLVHGLGSHAEDWANLMPQLKNAGFHVYAIDLLGYGRSAHPADATYSIPEEAEYVEAFLAQHVTGKVNLVGWSMGGWVAMRVALDQPERIARLVLCDAAGIRFQPGFTPADLTPTSIAAIQKLYRLLMPQPVHIPEFLARDMLRRFHDENWVIGRSARSMFTGADLLDGRLGALGMPTLIVWGKQDHLIPLATGMELHRQIPQSVLEIYEGCGHLAPGQCADRVGPRLINFLDGRPPQEEKVVEIGTESAR